uniref:Annexin n=1 Tax=Parastrongyloides trichosuri TaxID=131310 RepID=A0A0N4Z1U3_PARTI
MHTARPSIKPHDDFHPNHDAEALRKAMKGFGTDEAAIIRILTQRSNWQRQEILKSYKQLHGRDLIKDLKSELSGDFEDLIVALMVPPAEYDAQELHKAMAGLGTKESVLIEILCSRTNAQINEIKNVYQQKYKRDLEKDIKGDTSGYFERILVSLSTGCREECAPPDHLRANQDARELYRAGEMKLGTDESTFITILGTRSNCHLAMVFDEYEKVAEHTIEHAVKGEFSGDIKKSLLAIIEVVRNTPMFFAGLLYDSMKGLGTRDKDLIRIIVSRSEIDLRDIAMAFERKYNKTLADMIKGDCGGDYRDALLAIIKGN